MSLDYSIVICTYNPDERLLRRCLKAVAGLNVDGLNTEVLLVDNNSTVPLSTVPYIQEFLTAMTSLRLITELNQGLTPARMAGIRAAEGFCIVFFDDDNEPESGYLQELSYLNREYGHVTAWGPGEISVDFIDGIDPVIERFARSTFQERHDTRIEYANTVEWQHCYPFGTGMCVKAEFLKHFEVLVSGGSFTMPDRQGNSLSSGGDVQIILTCVKEGRAAGVSPGMKLKHMIPAKRANFDYIKRLLYGVYLGGSISRLEVFPEYKEVIVRKLIPASRLSRKIFKKYIKMRFKNKPEKIFDFVMYMAAEAGIYLALDEPVPAIVTRLAKRMKLE